MIVTKEESYTTPKFKLKEAGKYFYDIFINIDGSLYKRSSSFIIEENG